MQLHPEVYLHIVLRQTDVQSANGQNKTEPYNWMSIYGVDMKCGHVQWCRVIELVMWLGFGHILLRHWILVRWVEVRSGHDVTKSRVFFLLICLDYIPVKVLWFYFVVVGRRFLCYKQQVHSFQTFWPITFCCSVPPPITSLVCLYHQTISVKWYKTRNVRVLLTFEPKCQNQTKTSEEQVDNMCLDALLWTKISKYTNCTFNAQTQLYRYDHKLNNATSQTTEISISTVCTYKTSVTSNCSFTLAMVSFEFHPRQRQSISSKSLNDPDLPT